MQQVLQMILRDIFDPFSTNVVLKVAYVAFVQSLTSFQNKFGWKSNSCVVINSKGNKKMD